ncbi:MAG TPA: acyltransferase family protein [Microbacterium sp.]|nr:acyltransferase family protein [Microbacterium sp.]
MSFAAEAVSARPTGRLSGLDGLRAIAVSLVVIYHLFPQWWLHGGFIGVDVFFVISGFLITTLLLNENDKTGTIRLVPFWQRRARRLLPALAVLVTVCASAAWLIGGDVLVKMGSQIVGAATFSYNWVSLAAGTSYFTQDTPELFRNLWSLAVEEQFYVLWPLVLPLFLLLPWGWLRSAVALIAAGASAVWMGALILGGADMTRPYFGTDSHSFGILLGVAVAFALRRVVRNPSGWMLRLPARILTLIIGVAAVVGLIAVGLVPAGSGIATFPGTLAAASLLSAVAIIAGVWPRSWFGPAIDVQPLRWIGDRSYGIYLWHWPLIVLLMAWLEGTGPGFSVPIAIGAAALAITLIAAELSYRFIEQPVRRLGFRGSFALLGRRLAGAPAARLGAFAGLAAWVLVIGGTTAAIAAAPQMTSAEEVVAAGQDALDEADASSPPATPETAEPEASSPPPSPSPVVTDPVVDPGATDKPIPPEPTPIAGDEVTAVGDSVMLASAKALLDRFPGISVDATVSRSMWAAPTLLRGLERDGKLRQYVVLALGTNGPIAAQPMGEVLDIIGPDRRLILVDAYAPRSWIKGVNHDLRAFAAAHDNVVVADWSGAIGDHVDLLAGDHIHPGGGGGKLFAETVGAALDHAEQNRVDAIYHEALRQWRLAQLDDYRARLGML